MKKKGVSNIITTVIFVVLILILVSMLGLFFRQQLIEEGETLELQSQLSGEEYHFKKIVFGPNGEITLIIVRGSGDIYLESENFTEKFADIVFVLDTTGSMAGEIKNLTVSINAFADALENQDINARLALIDFKDYPTSPCGSLGDFPYRIHQFGGDAFTEDAEQFKRLLGNTSIINASGGADHPESHLTAIQAASNLNFNPDAQKYIVAISDIVPHAKDCCMLINQFSSPYQYNNYLNGSELPPEDICAEPIYVSTYPRNGCYQGPEYILDLSESLTANQIVFYYIGKNKTEYNWTSLCPAGRSLYNTMTSLTGGKFYEYSESDQESALQEIIPDLAD